MPEEINATVTLKFACLTEADLTAQQGMIAEDLGRLSDADSNTGVACLGFQIDAVKRQPKKRIHFLCSECGSKEVRADAYSQWDPDAGAWVLHSVYDDKHCESCDTRCHLDEVDEATGIEIGAYGMFTDGEGARLVQDHEEPDFYDLIVKTIPREGGGTTKQTHVLHEFDDMTKSEVEIRLASMAQLYPLAGVECLFGGADQ